MRHKYTSAKSTVVLLALILVLSAVLAACGGSNENTANEGSGASGAAGEVKLKMILLGGKPVDYELVFAELNKKLKEKMNATLEVEFLDWSDWNQKYPLKFAANEDFDLVYTSSWAYYNDQAIKGGFLEITDEMLQKNAPLTWEKMPKVSWDQAKINGKLYMVPNNNLEITNKVVLYREDLRKKYGLPAINSLDTYATYLKTVAANEKGITAFGAKAADGWRWHELDQIALEQNNDFKVVDLRIPLAYKLDDTTGKVFNVYETPEFKSLLGYYKDLSDNGAWSKNVVTNKNDIWQDMKAGKVSSYAHNLGTTAFNLAEARRDTPEQEYAIADITPGSKKLGAISTQNGVAIHATTKQPEKALMLIDLLQNDKEIHDLTMYGIAGTHYNPEGDDKFSPGPSASNYTGFSNWGWNSYLNRQDSSYPVEADDIFNNWQENVYHYPLETFVFDDAKVKSEVANISNVMVRYGIPLEYGLIQDLDQGLAALNSQLKAAGIDKVQQEMQSQIDAFLAK
ncbi:ABC transporter substrate-binding protein [Paenibacillus massiliensis]|uniref:ABC transporter substrate-binding protein n=1 Tax=Paenibacillus massiliensis TaxID=225917 RepID=UPI00046E9531|nr:ABC transporter substrate-binding protein [Paenibacillus massiliensis]